MQLQAAFAKVDITPPLGREVPGGFFKSYAKGVHDPLYARAAFLDNGEHAIAIVSVDCVFVEAPCVLRARERVSEWLGREVDVLIAATHTHSGGPTGGVLMSEPDPVYVDWVADQAATAIVLACNRAQPAFLRTAIGGAEGVAFNRRFRMKDGSVRTNPGYDNDDIAECLGPADPDVGAIAAYDEFGAMLGAMVNFTCHSTFMGGVGYSGDYAAWIEARMGAPTVFLPGAIGDVNQCDFLHSSRERDSGEKAARRSGARIAQAALKALAQEPLAHEPTLSAISEPCLLPVRGPSDEQLEDARKVWDAPGDMTQQKVYAREHLLLAEMVAGIEAIECELQALRIGDMRIGAAALQPFCQLGLDVKRGMDKVIFAGLANGHLGYVGPRHAYEEGGYELELKRTSRLAPGAGEVLVEGLRGLLQRLG